MAKRKKGKRVLKDSYFGSFNRRLRYFVDNYPFGRSVLRYRWFSNCQFRVTSFRRGDS